MSRQQRERKASRRKRAARFFRDPPWWFRDVIVVLVVSALLSAVLYWVQDASDGRRADQALKSDERIARLQTRLSNLQFVRDHSNTDPGPRPFNDLDLADQQLGGLRLEGSDFRGADLRGADLRESDLRGTDFAYADLRSAVFFGADLSGAQFVRGELSSAGGDHISGTLEGANLSHAKLVGVKFEALGRMNLTGAILYGSDLTNVAPDALTQLDGACFDESTTWPKGFTPKKSASDESCTRGWLEVFYPAHGQKIPWSSYGIAPN